MDTKERPPQVFHENDQLFRYAEMLKAISLMGAEIRPAKGFDTILLQCASLLVQYNDYPAVGVFHLDTERADLSPLAIIVPGEDFQQKPEILEDDDLLQELLSGLLASLPDTTDGDPLKSMVKASLYSEVVGSSLEFSCLWRLSFQGKAYGAIAIFTSSTTGFTERELAFLEPIIADFCRALHTHDIKMQLKFERDFNTEIVDTIQALMVSISPCGEIRRFNPEAEKVTGFQEHEVIDKYWVDILLDPDNRLNYQRLVSELLKENLKTISFRAELKTKTGSVRIIDWHGSIKPDITEGTVGMVLFGLDITDQLAVDKAYSNALAKWENIFSTIQDPALIVTRKGIILDANHATFSASRKKREQVIGKSVCKILHGDVSGIHDCPLMQYLKLNQSRILHTELSGLHGDYLLTLSPISRSNKTEEATLLVARDMTEEERLRAEAIRASQLASIGELAAGVAHEINNPINGILNYAQMLQDLTSDSGRREITNRIITESRRIEGIVRNLLDFSRHRHEDPEPVCSNSFIMECVDLVRHQLRKEHIKIVTDSPKNLPLAFCNPSQIKQVILNVLSNSRYALNERFPGNDPNKKISIKIQKASRGKTECLRIVITDLGSGIEHHLLERIFDPFFSTKPDGEGTGLGLSISYGLIRDNSGYIRVTSERGKYTSTIIDLPTAIHHGAAHDLQ
ncbi:MAG: PAS domain-containing sensor histidine kinase [Desulfobulbaceae bacterium]|nr:MAG: PAS domain-containing sensor histidine kinase [Desulfobulbaceae bacterium]